MSATWNFDPRVDAHAFQVLGFSETSSGISRTQRENREGWWAHARHHRAFILEAAARVEQPRLAVVLGAGKAYDLPLPELAKRFDRVVLIDIDADAMAASSAATVTDGKLRARLELRAMDLTGVTARIAAGIQAALSSERPDAQLEALCASYRLNSPPRFIDKPADLLVSGMVLSQLGLQPKLAVKRLYVPRFGSIPAALAAAWDDLERRLQQDHIDALGEQAHLAVLTSDVIHHSGGESWSAIGAAQLTDRLPATAEVLSRREWSWERVRNAVRTDVHAVLLRGRPG